MKISPLLILFLISMNFATAQSTTYGIVTDAETGEPIMFANIIIEGTQRGTTTDLDGKYSIQNDSMNLRFSFIGYEDFVAIRPTGNLDIAMSENGNIIGCPTVIIIDQRIKSAHNYSLLDSKNLLLQNQVDLSPILNTTPGVFMHSGALNTNRITIRGIGSRSPFSTNKIKAYLDDIPLTNGSGETTIEDIDLSFIKDIEIWKGPASSRFGAGLGGTIVMNSNFYQRPYVSTHFTMGAFGLQRNTVDIHLTNPKKGSQIHLNHNFTSQDGYRENNEYTRQGLTFLASQGINDNELKLLFNFTKLKAFIPSSLNETDFENDPTKAAFTWGRVKGFEDYDRMLAGITYQQQLKNNKKIAYSFFLNSRRAYELRPFNILTENSLSAGGRITFNWVPLDQWSFNIGTEFFRETYDWETHDTNNVGELLDPLSINAEKRLYANLFGEAIYTFDIPLKINTGLNVNTTRYDLEDRFGLDSIDFSGDYSFDPVVSPRLTLSYSPQRNMDCYALVSHGFSPPSLEETLNPDGTINPAIQPETAWNIEVGTRSYNADNRLQYELTLFQMWVENLLVARRTDFDQFIGINAGETIHRGLELKTSYDFFRKVNKKLKVQLAYNFSDFTFAEFEEDGEDYAGNELTGIPKHQANGILTGQFFGFYGNLNFVYVHEQPLRDDNSIYSDAYSLIHSKIGYQLTLQKKWTIDCYIGANNILDKHYSAMHQINAGSFGGNAPRYYYPGLPRHFYAGLKIKRSLHL